MTKRVFVNLGEIYFGQGDVRIETLLGSCVAITIWHPERRLGGLCHFLLPERLNQTAARKSADKPDGRYGDEALSGLLEHVRQYDAGIADYTVKVFGGGSVLDLPLEKNRVGQANADFALAILRRQNINVAVSDIAGEGYRYLRFDLASGDVWVRRGQGVAQQIGKPVVAPRQQTSPTHGDKDQS